MKTKLLKSVINEVHWRIKSAVIVLKNCNSNKPELQINKFYVSVGQIEEEMEIELESPQTNI